MPTNIMFKNGSQLNTLRVKKQDAEVSAEGKKTGKWKPAPPDSLVKPGEYVDAWVGETRRVIFEEIPT